MQIRIATRGSDLARIQAKLAAGILQRTFPHVGISFQRIRSTGDKDRKSQFQELGGIGLFTKEGEEALLRGEVDLVVHSLKDLPTVLPAGLTLAAVLEREDPRDALCGCKLAELRSGMRVGTSSLRRRAQILKLCPGVEVLPIRGNVPPRLRKARNKEGIEATILAVAGLNRLSFQDQIDEYLEPRVFPYAVGQGAIAIETRTSSVELNQMLKTIEHVPTRIAVNAERDLLHTLGAGCSLPVGVSTAVEGERLTLISQVTAPDGSTSITSQEECLAADANAGKRLAQALIEKGAGRLLQLAEAEVAASRNEF